MSLEGKFIIPLKELEDINETVIENYLMTSDLPPLDLMIRTSAEVRLSNFLLWQCAYSEFVWLDTLWPEFTTDTLLEAISIYQSRNRRFGGT